MNPNKFLKNHIFGTYMTQRIGLVVIGIAFPILLWVGGAIQGIEIQTSMSAYYHANLNDATPLTDVTPNDGVMRSWFVGILFTIGAILYLYKGYNPIENYVLNFAGVFAIGIAIFPMEWNCGDECKKISIHGICAIAFFLCIAYVCIFCAKDTLELFNDKGRERRYQILYILIGFGMILSPLIALLLTLVLKQTSLFPFFAEAAGVWVFAAYWLLKSREIFFTYADVRLRNRTQDHY